MPNRPGVTDTELLGRIRLLSGPKGVQRAISHYQSLKSPAQKARFLRLWKQAHNTDLLKLSGENNIRRGTKLIAAPVTKPEPKIKQQYRQLRNSTFAGILLLIVCASVLVGLSGYYEGNSLAQTVFAPVSSVLDTVGEKAAGVFAEPPCPHPVAKLQLTPSGVINLPEASKLNHPGGIIELTGWEQWKGLLQKNPAQQQAFAEGLALKMPKYPIGPLSQRVMYDYKAAYALSIQTALEQNRPCLLIPDPTESVLGAVTKLTTTNLATTESPLYKVQDIAAPPGIFHVTEAPEETRPATTPQPTSTPVYVLQIQSEFQQGITAINIRCGMKYQDPVERQACTAIVVRGLKITEEQTNLEETLGQVDKLPASGTLCNTNLGNLSWDQITQGNSPLWTTGESNYKVYGDPAQMVFIQDEAQDPSKGVICATANDVTTVLDGSINWLTMPEDPFVPGLGTPTGYGRLSIVSENPEEYQLGQVFLSPIK